MCTDWTEKDRVHLGEELSDVLIYLVRLSERCHVDLPAAAIRKFRLNAEKYPTSSCSVQDQGLDHENTSSTARTDEEVALPHHLG